MLGTAGYNNKNVVSDGKFSLGKNDEVNSLVLEPATARQGKASGEEPVIPMPKGHSSHRVPGPVGP